jgi:methylated-DNA-protein-cysteine methyltransferase-like protein
MKMQALDRQQRMERIWSTIEDIPPGKVASYGQLAEIAGIPRGARQVGYALRHSPKDRSLPWHRVLQASGKSAFAKGSAALRTQRSRLAAEGVTMCDGKVDMRTYRWQPDLDELFWKPSAMWDEE